MKNHVRNALRVVGLASAGILFLLGGGAPLQASPEPEEELTAFSCSSLGGVCQGPENEARESGCPICVACEGVNHEKKGWCGVVCLVSDGQGGVEHGATICCSIEAKKSKCCDTDPPNSGDRDSCKSTDPDPGV